MNRDVHLGNHQHTLLKLISISVVTALLASCMVGPDFKPLPPPQTQQYTNTKTPKKTVSTARAKNAGKSQQFVAGQDITGDWWTIFHSSKLNALITASITDNADLESAKAALREANDTLYAETGGLLLPSVNFQGNAERAQTNPILAGVTNQGPALFSVYNASFQTS